MSNNPDTQIKDSDALSCVLSRLQLNAEIYVDGQFSGTWAVDTSGSRRIPFHLIGQGEAWLHTDNLNEKRLYSGNMVLFPHDDVHIVSNSQTRPEITDINQPMTNDNDVKTHLICGFFEFKNKAAWPILDSLPAVIILDLKDMSINASMRTLIDLLLAELTEKAPGYSRVVNQLSYLLFIQIIRQQIQIGAVKSGLLAALFDTKINLALQAIHNHPEKNWTLESLASQTNMGRSSFAKRFHDLTGSPPLQYLTAWRMQEAICMLKETNMAIIEIAEKCGYESEPAFRKAFKKLVGKTPGKVRKSRELS